MNTFAQAGDMERAFAVFRTLEENGAQLDQVWVGLGLGPGLGLGLGLRLGLGLGSKLRLGWFIEGNLHVGFG